MMKKDLHENIVQKEFRAMNVGLSLNFLTKMATDIRYGKNIVDPELFLLEFLLGYHTYGLDRYCGEDGQRPVHCRCTFEWNDNENKLEFSKSFHECRNVEVPCLHEELSLFCHDLTIDFSRNNNTFNLTKIERNIIGEFEIYNGETDELIYSVNMDLVKNYNYFIAPPYEIPYDDNPNFKSFKIKIFELYCK